jgi:hypothetical protein
MCQANAQEQEMAEKYVEAIFNSDARFLNGFLLGYLAGSGKSWRFFMGSEAGIAAESVTEKLKELVGLSKDHQHVIIDQEYLACLTKDGGAAAQAGLKSEADQPKPIASGEFSLNIKDASREDAAAIREIIRDLSPALVASAWQEKEQVHEDGKGVELYAPLHDYVYQASGSFSGEISALIDLRQKLQAHPCAHVEPIKLNYQ